MPSALKERKNFFILLFAVAAFMLFMLWVINDQVVGSLQVNRLKNEALSVYLAAKQTISEHTGEFLSDAALAQALTGTVNDQSRPGQARISARMNELLAPDIVLSGEPGDGKSKVSFEIRNGQIVSLCYEAMAGSRSYAVTMDSDGTAAAERVK